MSSSTSAAQEVTDVDQHGPIEAVYSAVLFATSVARQAMDAAQAAGVGEEELADVVRQAQTAAKVRAAAEVEEPGAVASRPFGASWLPVELTATVDGLVEGTLERPAPTIGRIDGGDALFYAGRVNGIAGESGSGKSWAALYATAQELEVGENVVYIDMEDDAAGIVSRLLDLGVDPAAVWSRLSYISPEERLDAIGRQSLLAVLSHIKPSLVVVDSTGEGLALQGANPNADEDVAAWFRQVPRLLTSTGAAVVVLDHVAKAHDGGLWPIGSQRKRAAIDGAQYMQDVVRPFSREAAGAAVLRCAKDRHGTYRAGQRVAELRVAPSHGGGVEASLVPAGEVVSAGGRFRPTGYMERVSRVLEVSPEPLTYNGIRDRVTGKKEHIRAAVDVLITEGFIATAPGSNRSTMHSLIKPFSEAAEEAGTTRHLQVIDSGGPSGPGPKEGDRGPLGLTGPRDHLGTTGDHRSDEAGICSRCSQPLDGAARLVSASVCSTCELQEVGR